MKNNYLVTAILIIAFAAGAFYGGTLYQKSKQPSFGQFNRGTTNGTSRNGITGTSGGQRGQGQGFRPVNGQIISADDKSITVKLTDGSSKIVLFSGSTQINKATQGTKSDLTQGTTVAVFGQDNSDGSVTAQNIQLNPVSRDQQSQNPGQGQN